MDTSQLTAEDRKVLRFALFKTAEMARQANRAWTTNKHDPRAPMLAHEADRFAQRAMVLYNMIEKL